jgi:hypothetical protein
MNCLTLNTASEILQAFQTCANPGEEIELFECLATRPNPPIAAFVEILQKIKLEAALALTIQVFSKITDTEVNRQLRQSDDLLAMLSEQARSGSTDLIRWAAATTIEIIGFDFIAVSQYLTEEPQIIIRRIVQSKVKILTDAERNEQKITDRNDYTDFIRFWIYGPTYDLRVATSGILAQGQNSSITTVEAVVKAQSVWGIKQTNALLEKAEKHDYSDDSVKQIYENYLFETSCQVLSSALLKQSQNGESIDILINNQIHCLQSNDPEYRRDAALTILGLDKYLLDKFQIQNPQLLLIVTIFSRNDFGIEVNYPYKELTQLIKYIKQIELSLKRIQVRQDCEKWRTQLLNEVKNREYQLENEHQNIYKMKLNVQQSLLIVRSIDHEFYAKLSSINFDTIPKVSVEFDDSPTILHNYQQSLIKDIKRHYNDFLKLIQRRINDIESINIPLLGRKNILHSRLCQTLNSGLPYAASIFALCGFIFLWISLLFSFFDPRVGGFFFQLLVACLLISGLLLLLRYAPEGYLNNEIKALTGKIESNYYQIAMLQENIKKVESLFSRYL